VIDIGAVMQGVQIGVEALPLVVGLIDGLVKAGQMSEADAAIVKVNIESRRAAYMRAKAEDERALAVKHGTPDELVTDVPAAPGIIDPWRDADDS
jgi:hypothetical protein